MLINYLSTAQLFTTVRLHSVTDLSGKKPNVASRQILCNPHCDSKRCSYYVKHH